MTTTVTPETGAMAEELIRYALHDRTLPDGRVIEMGVVIGNDDIPARDGWYRLSAHVVTDNPMQPLIDGKVATGHVALYLDGERVRLAWQWDAGTDNSDELAGAGALIAAEAVLFGGA